MEDLDIDAAFRAGVRGLPFCDPALLPNAVVVSERPPGGNENLMAATERLPGLSDPRAAYRTGRALRGIGAFLDDHQTPVKISQEIRAAIAGAILVHYLRDSAWPWGEVATVDVFLEGIGASLKAHGVDAASIRNALLAYARREPSIEIPVSTV